MRVNLHIFLIVVFLIIGNSFLFSQNKYDTIAVSQILKDAENTIEQSPERSLDLINRHFKKINTIKNKYYYRAIFLKAQAFYKLNKKDTAEKYFQIIVKNNPEKLQNKIKEVKTYNYLGLIYMDDGEYNKASDFFNKSLEKSIRYNLKYREAAAHSNLSLIYDELGFYDKSISHLSKSINLFKTLQDTVALIGTYNNLGLLFQEIKDFKNAENYLIKSAALSNKINNYDLIAQSYLNLGYFNTYIGNSKKALEFLEKSHHLLKNTNDFERNAENYLFTGNAYLQLQNKSEAIKNYKKAYSLFDKLSSLDLKIKILNKLACFYIQQKDFKNAHQYLTLTKQTLAENKEFSLNENYLKNLSLYYEKKKDYYQALKFHKKYIELKDSLNNKRFNEKVAKQKVFYESDLKQQKIDELENKEKLNALINKKQKDRIKLVTYLIILSILFSALSVFVLIYVSRQLKQKNRLYASLQENRKTLLEKNREIIQQNEEIRSQTEQMYQINDDLMQLKTAIDATDNAVVILDKHGNFEWGNKGFDRLYDIDFKNFIKKYPNILDASKNSSNFVEMSRVIKKCIAEKTSGSYEFSTLNRKGDKIWVKTNIKAVTDLKGDIQNLIVIDTDITDKVKTGRLLEIRNHELERQKEEIDSGLRYAKTIQNAILPVMSNMMQNNEFFLIYLPRDIVSGDFYWYLKKEESPYTFYAVVDCTGHGVPGAFMSMIGARLLNHIVSEKNIHLPSEILEQLNLSIKIALKQKLSGNKDGMDISLVRFEKTPDNKTKIYFSGAKQSIFIFKKKENKLTKIRGDIKSIGGYFDEDIPFTNKKIIAEKGDIIYLFSDGIIDQNSDKGRKIGTPGFQKMLEQILIFPLKEQKEMLLDMLNKFKENVTQRDDITILGIKIE